MGMDLYRVKDGAYFRWSRRHWLVVLSLAEKYGWQPAGTEEPIRELERGGDGGYTANGYQIITGEDAANLVTALEEVLPDIPNISALDGKTVPWPGRSKSTPIIRISSLDLEQLEQLADEALYPVSESRAVTLKQWNNLNEFERLAGLQNKIKDFIDYLRVGGCEIG